MGQRRLSVRNRRVGWGCSRWRPWARRCWRRWPRHRGRREPSRSTGRGHWPTRSRCSSRRRRGRTTDVHLLAWNDFHGNLEAGAGLNIYGQFAGGAAWLAKAVQDKQAPYGDKQISVIAGDNIGASPLVDGLVLRRAVDDRHQPDERRLRLGRQPRVRQGLGRAAADPERRLPSRRRLHRRARTRWPTAAPPTPIPAPTSSTCRPTSCATTTARRCSRPSAPSRSRATAARSSRSASSARCSRPRPRSSRRPAWPASPSRTRPTPPTGRGEQLQKQGREHQRARDPPGRLPGGHGQR